MKKRYRFSIAKLLVFSILFLQLSLSFHTHSPEESVHCDACVTTHHADHDTEAGESCWAGVFFHANLAVNTVATVRAAGQLPLVDAPESPKSNPVYTSFYLPLGSRAPPIL